jgi:hypothetical protein
MLESFSRNRCPHSFAELPGRPAARGARVLLALIVLLARPAAAYTGQVSDASTSAPIANAIVTLGDQEARTDRNGRFDISGSGAVIGFRAYGYLAKWAPVDDFKSGRDIRLTPFRPKALYLSSFGIANRKLRESALSSIATRGLNAVVIDIKSDRGLISYKSSVALARQIGAGSGAIPDPKSLLARLHQQHLYVIARIIVFKDDRLATARPALAVKRAGGAVYRDREHCAWTDPFNKQVWDYNIAVAVEAASLGFDEIQFDYVRFPDDPGLVFSMPNTMANRIGAVVGFLTQARKQLVPYNVFLAADIFGYVMWNQDDTHIGQRLQELSNAVDYISPMLYPSCFQFGIPGYRVPIGHPYEIISDSLHNGSERTGIAPIRFRPWLQAFRDYAFDRRLYRVSEIDAQIKAAENFGADGWMLWNPRNIYFADDFEAGPPACGAGDAR